MGRSSFISSTTCTLEAHCMLIDSQNTFTLPTPHASLFGIGVSILFQASIGLDSAIPAPRLIVASSGADFRKLSWPVLLRPEQVDHLASARPVVLVRTNSSTPANRRRLQASRSSSSVASTRRWAWPENAGIRGGHRIPPGHSGVRVRAAGRRTSSSSGGSRPIESASRHGGLSVTRLIGTARTATAAAPAPSGRTTWLSSIGVAHARLPAPNVSGRRAERRQRCARPDRRRRRVPR